MIYLILAIISSSLVSIVMRVSGKYLKSNLGMTVTNYVICTAMAALYSGVGNLFPSSNGFAFTLGTGVFTGALYLAGLLLIQFNIKKNGVVMSAIFQKLGLVIQVLLSIIVFKEQPEVLQIIGIIICLVSVIVINFEKEQTIIQFKLGLALILLVSGFCDGMSKVHEEMGSPSLSEHFLLYTFGTALILCLGLVAYKKESIGRKDIGFGILLGVPNYFSAKFLLQALKSVPAVITFPTYSVGTIAIITLVGVIVFKERLSKKQVIGTIGILVALALLNI